MSFRLGNFISDPFALSTVSFAIIAWIVAIAGSASTPSATFPRFTWWGLVYEIIIVILIFLFYCFNIIELYKFTLVGMLSVAFLYTTNSTNQLIYLSGSSTSAAAAGCILLSMVNIIWIFYFGGHPESPTNQFVDAFSLRGSSTLKNDSGYKEYQGGQTGTYAAEPQPTNGMMTRFQDSNLRQSTLTRGNSKVSGSAHHAQKPYVASSQLNGLENFSQNDLHRERIVEDVDESDDARFKHRARALYSYEANPDDVNEISFDKGEMLEVDDIEGKWWQARRANGQIGICPSNYVELLE